MTLDQIYLKVQNEEIELTELEKETCRSCKKVNGQWVGVDFIPAEDREKDTPFILEVNHFIKTLKVLVMH